MISRRLAGREEDRLAHVGVDVREHRGEVRERADVRVAGVEEHDRRGPEAIGEQQPQRGRIDKGQVEVGVAETGVELDRHALARRLLDGDDDEVIEQRLRLDPEPAVAPGRSWTAANAAAASDRVARPRRGGRSGRRSPTSCRRSRGRAGRRSRPGTRRGSASKSGRLEDQSLDQRLEPEDLLDPARGERPELVERVRRVGAVARVDEPGLEVAALDDRRASATRARARGAPHGPRPPSARSRAAPPARGSSSGRSSDVRDVVAGDLREGRLGQVDPEGVVVGRLLAQQRMAVVVDDRDRVEVERHRGRDQYLKKCWSSSNASSLLGVRGGLRAPDLEVLGAPAAAPSAPISTASASSSSSASPAVSGKRRMPRRSRSSSLRLPGSCVDRLARVESTLDAVERRRDHAAERDVRVGARVARLELEVGRARLVVPVAARDADRRLAVLDPPGRVGGAPVVGLEPPERVDARRRQRRAARAGGRGRPRSRAGPAGQAGRGARVREAVHACGRRPRCSNGGARRCPPGRPTAWERAMRPARAARRRRGRSGGR